MKVQSFIYLTESKRAQKYKEKEFIMLLKEKREMLKNVSSSSPQNQAKRHSKMTADLIRYSLEIQHYRNRIGIEVDESCPKFRKEKEQLER